MAVESNYSLVERTQLALRNGVGSSMAVTAYLPWDGMGMVDPLQS